MAGENSSVESWRDPIVAEVRQARETLLPKQTMTFASSADAYALNLFPWIGIGSYFVKRELESTEGR